MNLCSTPFPRPTGLLARRPECVGGHRFHKHKVVGPPPHSSSAPPPGLPPAPETPGPAVGPRPPAPAFRALSDPTEKHLRPRRQRRGRGLQAGPDPPAVSPHVGGHGCSRLGTHLLCPRSWPAAPTTTDAHQATSSGAGGSPAAPDHLALRPHTGPTLAGILLPPRLKAQERHGSAHPVRMSSEKAEDKANQASYPGHLYQPKTFQRKSLPLKELPGSSPSVPSRDQ